MKTIIDFIWANQEYTKSLIARATCGTNLLEGLNVSYQDTENLLLKPLTDNKLNLSNKEIYAVQNHGTAMQLLFQFVFHNQIERKTKGKDYKLLSTQDLLEHIASMMQQRNPYAWSSLYRKEQTTNELFAPSAPQDIEQKLVRLIENYERASRTDIFKRLARFLIDFEKIRPFANYNGQIARLFVGYELLSRDLPYPILPLQEHDKEIYRESIIMENQDDLAYLIAESCDYELGVLISAGCEKRNLFDC